MVNPSPNGAFLIELVDRVRADREINPVPAVRNAISCYRRAVQIWLAVEARAQQEGVDPGVALDRQMRDIEILQTFDGLTVGGGTLHQRLRDSAHTVLDAGASWDGVPAVWEALIAECTFERLPLYREGSQPDITDR